MNSDEHDLQKFADNLKMKIVNENARNKDNARN